MIGCGHVSGLEVRLCHMPRAGMEIRYSSGEGRLYAEDVIVKIAGPGGTMIVSA